MQENQFNPHKSSLGGMDANTMALLCYLASAIVSFIPVLKYAAWAAPLIIFFVEKESFFVRFHAMQAFTLNLVGSVISLIVSIIIAIIGLTAALNPFGALAGIGFVGIIIIIINIVILVFSIIAMINAHKYLLYKVPVVGKITDKFMDMFSSKN